MKNLLPAVLLLAGACGMRTSDPDADQPRPIARTTGQTTQTEQIQRLRDRNVVDAAPAEPTGATQPLDIDTTRKFEYVDIIVNLEDPTGMRALVPYLIKPESWTLIKCEMTSTTSKHYRFQKVASTDGRSLPEVDVFKTRR